MSNHLAKIEAPKIFISYCWTNLDHEEWVVDLAKRLVSNGVDVILDKWDLKEGHDSYYFMEKSINREDVKRVLIICDKGYKKKADNRKGGVGTEAQIISPEIYENTKQEKFIPILSERDEEGKGYVPTFIKSRIYIDLSNEDTFEDSYEKLLRNIFEQPSERKPALGNPPSFLFENEQIFLKTTNINRQIESLFKKKNIDFDKVKHVKNVFFEELLVSLNEFSLTNFDVNELEELVVNSIKEMEPLRNDFVKYVDLMTDFKEIYDLEEFINFFESAFPLTQYSNSGTFYDSQFDNIKFFIEEIFIYFVATLLNKKMYSDLHLLLNTEFMYKVYRANELSHSKFELFNFWIPSLERYNKKTKRNRLSIKADLICERCNLKKFPKEVIVQTDLLLHYLGQLLSNCNWFPTTYFYLSHQRIELLERLKSKRHFENIKSLFNVSDSVELTSLFENYNKSEGHSNSFESIPELIYHIDFKKIGSLN